MHRQAVRRSSWAKSEDRVRRIKATLGDVPLGDLDYRQVTEWQATLARTLSPWIVRHHRQTLTQVVDEAVKMGALVGNPVRAVKPLRIGESEGIALDREQTAALLRAARDHRLGAAVAMLFLQGWRISEVLGLAWEDLDFDASTAHVRRASVYIDGRGQQLGPTKTDGARGEHWLMPTVVELLERRRDLQAEERASAPTWKTITYQGRPLDLVFTTPAGGLVLRQNVAKIVKQAARAAGIAGDDRLGTHVGRQRHHNALRRRLGSARAHRRFVGHAKPATTAGYVKRLGRRPQDVAQRAATILDGQADDDKESEGSESGATSGSNDGSYGPESSNDGTNDDGR